MSSVSPALWLECLSVLEPVGPQRHLAAVFYLGRDVWSMASFVDDTVMEMKEFPSRG